MPPFQNLPTFTIIRRIAESINQCLMPVDRHLYAQGGARDEPVVAGVASQVIEALIRPGIEASPINSPNGNWILRLACEPLKLALDHVLHRSGADLLLHAPVVAASVDRACVRSVSISDLGKTFWISARSFVDASGDAVLASAAGAPVESGYDSERPRQPGSLPIRIGGISNTGPARSAMWQAIAKPQCTSNKNGAAVCRDGGIVLRLPMSNEVW